MECEGPHYVKLPTALDEPPFLFWRHSPIRRSTTERAVSIHEMFDHRPLISSIPRQQRFADGVGVGIIERPPARRILKVRPMSLSSFNPGMLC